MTSTDIPGPTPRFGGRLPPLPGLLGDLLDGALRARQRRVLIADSPGKGLAALRVSDKAIDRALLGASLYGDDAALQLDQRIAASEGTARDAAVFLRIALAVQTRDPALAALTVLHGQRDGGHGEHAGAMRAVRDAYWFFPVPNGPFGDDSAHIVALFDAARNWPRLLGLALELAGRRDVKPLSRKIAALLDAGDANAASGAHAALARMGMAAESAKQFIDAALSSTDPTRIDDAIGMAAVDPRLADDAALGRVLDAEAQGADPAWAILACRQGRRFYEYARGRDDLPDALRLRIVAIAGHIDGVIAACAEMADCDGPVTPMQADVLALALGDVPAEARCEPNERAAKSNALRALVLRVCRNAHIALANDAEHCAWDADEILFDPERAADIRLRAGAPLGRGAPPFGPSFFTIGHTLRGWLYIERAVVGGQALGLSALDVARRQELTVTAAAFAEEFGQ